MGKKRRAAKKSKKARKSKKGKRLTRRAVVAALRKLKGAVTYKALSAFLKKRGYKVAGLKKALRSLVKAKVVKAAKGKFSLTGKALKRSKKSKKARKARKAKKAKKSRKVVRKAKKSRKAKKAAKKTRRSKRVARK